MIWRRGERATGARYFRPFFERPEDFADPNITNIVHKRTAHAIASMRDPEGLQFVASALDREVASSKLGIDNILEPIVRAVLLLDPARAFERLAPLSLPTSKPNIRSRALSHVFTAFELRDWSTHSPLGRDGGLVEPRDPRWNDHLASWLDSNVPKAWEKVEVAKLLLRFGDARGLDALISALEQDEPLNQDACDALGRFGDERAAAALRAAGRRNKKLQRAYYAAAKTIEQSGRTASRTPTKP